MLPAYGRRTQFPFRFSQFPTTPLTRLEEDEEDVVVVVVVVDDELDEEFGGKMLFVVVEADVADAVPEVVVFLTVDFLFMVASLLGEDADAESVVKSETTCSDVKHLSPILRFRLSVRV
jgi:hypothetical protein